MRIDEGSYFDKPVGNNKTFRNLMERFMNEHAPKVGINTRKGYATYLKHLSSFFGDTNLMSISPKAISRYKVLRMDKGLRPATINRELSMLSTAFNLAINEWEWIKDNPVSRVTKEKENNQRDKWLTMDEERRLLENAPEWLSEIIIFALNTGLRQDELLSLEWCRVNHLRKTILIQKTKNGSPKTVPLNKTALAILEGRSVVKSVKNDLVFFNSNGKKVINFNLIRAFKRTAKNA